MAYALVYPFCIKKFSKCCVHCAVKCNLQPKLLLSRQQHKFNIRYHKSNLSSHTIIHFEVIFDKINQQCSTHPYTKSKNWFNTEDVLNAIYN